MFEQFKKLTEELNKYKQFLMDQSIKEYFWTKWNREEIKRKAEEVKDLFDEIACGYLDDYIVLIHNHLIYPILKYKKIPRENFLNMGKLEKYYILTEYGLKEIVNKKVN